MATPRDGWTACGDPGIATLGSGAARLPHPLCVMCGARHRTTLTVSAVAPAATAQGRRGEEMGLSASRSRAVTTAAPKQMVWVPGGEFLMGSEAFYPEERPAH